MKTDKLRSHALLCLDRLRLIVENATHLSDMEIIRLVGEINDTYSKFVQVPEPEVPDNVLELTEEEIMDRLYEQYNGIT